MQHTREASALRITQKLVIRAAAHYIDGGRAFYELYDNHRAAYTYEVVLDADEVKTLSAIEQAAKTEHDDAEMGLHCVVAFVELAHSHGKRVRLSLHAMLQEAMQGRMTTNREWLIDQLQMAVAVVNAELVELSHTVCMVSRALGGNMAVAPPRAYIHSSTGK